MSQKSLLQTYLNPNANETIAIIIMTAVAYYFVVLQPGMNTNVLPVSKERCAKLIPFPDQEIGNDCDAELPDNKILTICQARTLCHSVWSSGYTAPWTVVIQALFFALAILLTTFFTITRSYYFMKQGQKLKCSVD